MIDIKYKAFEYIFEKNVFIKFYQHNGKWKKPICSIKFCKQLNYAFVLRGGINNFILNIQVLTQSTAVVNTNPKEIFISFTLNNFNYSHTNYSIYILNLNQLKVQLNSQ